MIEGYSVLSGCNGSGLSASGGLGHLAAVHALDALDASAALDVGGEKAETGGGETEDGRAEDAEGQRDRQMLKRWDPSRDALRRLVGGVANDGCGPSEDLRDVDIEGVIRGAKFRDMCAAVRAQKFLQVDVK